MINMTELNFGDLMNEAKKGSALIPVGEHLFECIAATAGVAKDGIKPQIVADYRAAEGPFAGRTRRVWHTISTDNPTALQIFFRNMKAFGLDEKFFASAGPVATALPVVASKMVGKLVVGKVEHQPFNGEMTDKIGFLKSALGRKPAASAGGGAPAPAPAPAPSPAPQAAATAPAPAPAAAPAPAPAGVPASEVPF